jgi:hypothetical protein
MLNLFASWRWAVGLLPTIFGVLCILALYLFVSEPVRGEAERDASTMHNTTALFSKAVPSKLARNTSGFQSLVDDLRYLSKMFVCNT